MTFLMNIRRSKPMDTHTLAFMVEQLQLCLFRAGGETNHPARRMARLKTFIIVKQGLVRGEQHAGRQEAPETHLRDHPG